MLWLDLTRKCQLQCTHCYNQSGPDGDHGTMDRESWLRVIQEAAELGVARVQLIGGEPTMHPHGVELVDHALNHGMEVEVFSNLVHVSDRWWGQLQRDGVSLATSYYSDRAGEHNAITGRPSHRLTRENIRKAVRLGVPPRVGIIATDDAQRVDEARSERAIPGANPTQPVRRGHHPVSVSPRTKPPRRIGVDDLPDSHFRELIHPYTGDVTEVRRPARGFSSDFAAVIRAEAGRFFVKAMFNQPGGRLDSLNRERDIAPYVESVSPRLLWSADGEGWVILGFEAIDGRTSSFNLDSADLPVIVETLNRAAAIPTPSVARDWPETRWDAFAADEAEAELFRGTSLLHTDINPSNIMIGPDRAWIVDWSWPTRGAGFIDPATFVVQLISAGHTPAEAEAWAAGCRAWRVADSRAITAFAKATMRMYGHSARSSPAAGWLQAMEDAARSWVRYRDRA
ncbi:radical SAM protein [Streptomyces longispororuber]|uniref:radical SAM protein n=1 Tax=Streptomyces longispororuber TaxID=68230 RepID=UPI0037029A2E